MTAAARQYCSPEAGGSPVTYPSITSVDGARLNAGLAHTPLPVWSSQAGRPIQQATSERIAGSSPLVGHHRHHNGSQEAAHDEQRTDQRVPVGGHHSPDRAQHSNATSSSTTPGCEATWQRASPACTPTGPSPAPGWATVENTAAWTSYGAQACPDCRDEAGCPRDRFYRPITRIATLGQRRRLDKATSRTGCSTAPAGLAPPSASTSTGPTPLRGPHGLAGRGLVRRARQHHHRSQAPGPGPRRRLAPPRPAPGPAGLRGPRLDPQPRSGPRRGNARAGEPHQRPRPGRTRLLVDLAGARGSPRRQGGATARHPRRQAGPP